MIVENLPNGLYRYSSGPFQNVSEANMALQNLKQSGFADSFISMYKGNERIQILKTQ
ncbi:MAG: SPOR domain-containing protein [Bacteroidetes bacterium]|nr:SPOR domain-containing protein [Bacteroidota bacterium]